MRSARVTGLLGAGLLALALLAAGCGPQRGAEPSAPGRPPAVQIPAVQIPAVQTPSVAPPTAGASQAPSEEPSAAPSPAGEAAGESDPAGAPNTGAPGVPPEATPLPGYDYSQCVPQSEPVGEDFFADAAFIGDSRVDGFRLYSGLTQGDFLVKAGLSVFELEEDTIRVGEEKLTVVEALGRKDYAKVYVSLGVNELGMYDDQGYYDHYAGLIDHIRALQPQADIYVQLVTPVNEKKCAQNKIAYYVTNEQIAVYNALLRQLAVDKLVFLVDPAQVLTDETGQPPYDTVTDGVHFTRPTYAKWLEYLQSHTVKRGEDGSYEAPVEPVSGGDAVPESAEPDGLRGEEDPL